jgi:hypothetical protein
MVVAGYGEPGESSLALGCGLPLGITAAAAYSTCLGSSYARNREDRWDALLQASGRTENELTAIFQHAEGFYRGYEEATSTLPFDALNKQAWELAKSENGGFQERAGSYAINCSG